MNVTRIRTIRLLLTALAISAMVVAPVLAAGGGKTTAPGQNKDKVAKAPITISGTIEAATSADGRKGYMLTDGGKTYTLHAGPHWFFDEGAYPLEEYVGESVTIEGEIREGSDEVDVISVNGIALREPGKPPWAGGWKAVGERHPGWSREKADRMDAKFGDCFPRGQCKDRSDKASGEEDAAP